jgi:hypothetical protein
LGTLYSVLKHGRISIHGAYTTVSKAMDNLIANNEMQKAFIQWNEKLHSIG